jgi:acyl carrier protein
LNNQQKVQTVTDKEKMKLLADMFGVETSKITPEIQLDSLVWDSINKITFSALVNDHFEKTTHSSELKTVSTIHDLLKIME